MDKILFSKMQFYGYHGVFEEENRLGQKFEVDLEIFLDLKKAGETDCLENTVNYAEIYQVVEQLVTGKEKKLLESLAESIANQVLKMFPIQQVKVLVRKLQPPIPGHLESVAVEIVRGLNNNE